MNMLGSRMQIPMSNSVALSNMVVLLLALNLSVVMLISILLDYMVPNTSFSCKVNHHISSLITSLMQDVMKMVSSQMTLFDEFHKKILSIFVFLKKNLDPNLNLKSKIKP
jgi:competence protein ComGC